MTNGMRPLDQCRTLAERSSSHFGDFNATSHHLATRSTHLGSFPVTSVFLSGVDRTCKNLPSREVAPIGRQALYKTEVAPVISTLVQPDTLGCSVFSGGQSVQRESNWMAGMPFPVKSSSMGLVAGILKLFPCIWGSNPRHCPPLKALLPKFHWLIIARLSKVNRYADALETGADGKTDLVDNYRGWAWLPRIGEMFLIINLRMKPVRHGARTDISRSGVPTV